jgi:hypothetical protein
MLGNILSMAQCDLVKNTLTIRRSSTQRCKASTGHPQRFHAYLIRSALAAAQPRDRLQPRLAAGPTSCAKRLLAGLLGLGLFQGELGFQVVKQLLGLCIVQTGGLVPTILSAIQDGNAEVVN